MLYDFDFKANRRRDPVRIARDLLSEPVRKVSGATICSVPAPESHAVCGALQGFPDRHQDGSLDSDGRRCAAYAFRHVAAFLLLASLRQTLIRRLAVAPLTDAAGAAQFGPSGAGKSTIAHLLIGDLLELDSGQRDSLLDRYALYRGLWRDQGH